MSYLRLFLATASLLIGCAPGSYGDLGKPALVVVITEEGGFCSSVFAVDGDNAVWASGGCGDSIGSLGRRDMRVDASLRSELDSRMDSVLALPADPECDLPTVAGRRLRFLRTEDGVDDPPGVRLCEPGIPLLASRLAATLEGLAAPATIDAGSDGGGGAGLDAASDTGP